MSPRNKDAGWYAADESRTSIEVLNLGIYSLCRLRFTRGHQGRMYREVMYLGGTLSESWIIDLDTGEELTLRSSDGGEAKRMLLKQTDSWLRHFWPRNEKGDLLKPLLNQKTIFPLKEVRDAIAKARDARKLPDRKDELL